MSAPVQFPAPLEARYSRVYQPPAGERFGRLQAADGVELRTAHWHDPDALMGTIIVLGGRREFIEKYYETIHDLRDRGFAVHSMDWRGQGLSGRLLADRSKGHVRDFADYVGDLDRLIDSLPADLPRPLTLLGHSMGGHIVLRYLIEKPGKVDRAVLLAPMLGIETAPLPVNFIRRLARIATLFGLGGRQLPSGPQGTARDKLTSDPDRGAIQSFFELRDSKYQIGAPTLGWLDAAFRSVGRIMTETELAKVRIPLLMVVPGADRIVPGDAARAAADVMPKAHLIDIAEARHEILMERDQLRDQFWTAFDVFAAAGRYIPF